MRSLREIKRYVAKAMVHSNDRVNQAVLDTLLTELDEATDENSTGRRWKLNGPVLKLVATAAVLTIAVLLIDQRLRPGSSHPGAEPRTEVRIETVNAIGLNIAYQRGGMEAVEQQYMRTFKNSRPRPTRLSVERMLTELTENGDS